MLEMDESNSCLMRGVKALKLCDKCYNELKHQIKPSLFKEEESNSKIYLEIKKVVFYNLEKITNRIIQILHSTLIRECFTSSTTLKPYLLRPYIAELEFYINNFKNFSSNLKNYISLVKESIIKPIKTYSNFGKFPKDLKLYFNLINCSFLQIEALIDWFNKE